MPEVSFVNLFAVVVIAFAVPLLLGFAPGLRVPAVEGEIVVGIVVGPSVLGWVEPGTVVQVTALLGLAFLLFLAGLEIDVHRLRGPLLRPAGGAVAGGGALRRGAGAAARRVPVLEPLSRAVTPPQRYGRR